MATGNPPARSDAGLPTPIDVPSRETPAVLPDAIPPAVPDVAEPVGETTPKPPPRHLDTNELVTESTRLVVGALVATGRGIRAIVEQAVANVDAADGVEPMGDPGREADHEGVASSAVGASGAGESADPKPPVAALRAPEPPDTIMAALPTAALGVGLHAQRRLLAAVAETRDMYGPVVTWMLEAPVVSSVYQRARADVFAWYHRGDADKSAGAELALASLMEVSDGGLGYVFDHLDINSLLRDFDINPLMQNLELNDVIMSSTGGLATEALDNVRSQGVTIDDVIARISNRVFRRQPEKVPEGPPGEYGLQEELTPWTSR